MSVAYSKVVNMHFEDKLNSINAYICIIEYTVSGNIAGIAAILPALLQYRKNFGNTNLHAKSNIAATLRQYCHNIARNCCCNIAAINCQKACISIRVAYSESCNIAANGNIAAILQLLPKRAYTESCNIAASGNIAATVM